MNNILLENFNQTLESVKKDHHAGQVSFNVHLDWDKGTKNKAVIRDFLPLTIDEPVDFGGSNEGPNPVEYLLAGAAGCFAIGFEIFASRQDVKLEQLSIDIEGNLDLATFFGFVDGERGITQPVIKLKVMADAPREKIKKIAEQALEASVVLNSLKAKVELLLE